MSDHHPDRNDYLSASDTVDWKNDKVQLLAAELARDTDDEHALVSRCFEWVRDNIQHCMDFGRSEVTCSASEVLRVGTGFCYAKSHLLAALLRANGIQTGFCYQRLSVSGHGPPYSLHGLNAVFLNSCGWYRIDARGNSDTVHAEFCPPVEKLAFPVEHPQEADLPEIWPEPLPVVVNALMGATSAQELAGNLPDVQLFSRKTAL